MDPSAEAGSSASASSAVVTALALAAVLVAINLLSPLHVDDPFMRAIAERVLAHPGDPYGFDIMWVQWPQPVHEELTPPVVPYWWALGALVVGMRTWAIKLWFAPFVAALALGLASLLRRAAAGSERPFLVLALLSPAIAPSLNLMQDVPAYGLAAAGVALYLAAAATRPGGRGDGLALGAGLLLGLALQTKYPTATFLAAVGLHGLLLRRIRRSTIATVSALLVFGAWELYGGWRYGQGMFAGQLANTMYWVPRAGMIVPLVRLLGATLGAVCLAGLLASGAPRALVLVLGTVGLVGYAGLTVAPLAPWLFSGLGLLVVGVLATASWRLVIGGRPSGAPASGDPGLDERLVSWWLTLWLGGELLGYFVTAPFPAARRVIGPTLVGVLVVARLWSMAVSSRPADGIRRALTLVVVGGALIGLLHAAVDTLEARAQREAVDAVAAAIDAAGEDDSTVWYAGHWGFGEHARRHGWRPVITESSTLQPGDWLVIPQRVDRQGFELPPGSTRPRFEIELPARLALATLPGFYAGDATLTHLDGPRLRVDVSRVRRRVAAATDWPTVRLTNYVLRSPPLTAATAFPALVSRMARAPVEERRLAAVVLGRVAGPQTAELVDPFIAALDDADATVRREAAAALGRIGFRTATRARPALARCAKDDPSPEVRSAAAIAARIVLGQESTPD